MNTNDSKYLNTSNKLNLPESWTTIAVNPEFDNLMYWLDRCERKGHLDNCPDLIEPWTAFDYREVPQVQSVLKYIKIETLSDEHDCETCGTSWATGYEVTFPDGSIESLIPQASCFGGGDYSETDLMEVILNKLGYTTIDPDTSEGFGDPDEYYLE